MQIEEKVNILMVDDRPENLLALEGILSSLNENLVRAESGEEALKCLFSQDFAVILLDVHMPGLDGFETAALIRKRPRSHHTPIIFLTAFSKGDFSIFKGYSLGAVDYLLKPVEPEVLLSKVAVFVELFKKTREVKQKAAQLAAVNAQLSESEARFQAFMNNAPTVAFMKNAEDGRYVYVNQPYEQTFEKKLSEVQGKTDFEIWPPEYAGQLSANDQTLLKNGPSAEVVEKMPTPNGHPHYWQVFKFTINFRQRYIGGVAIDITERLQAEAELRKSEERHRLVVEGVKDYAIFMLNPSGHIISWNTEAGRMKGYTAEEIIGKHYSCLYPAEDIQRGVPEHALQVSLAEGRYESEGWRVRKDGTRFWAEVAISPLRQEDGRLGWFVKVTRDITERKRVENALMLRDRAIAAASDTILIAGPPENDNPIVYANPAFYELTGYTPEETLGRNCRFLQGPDTDRDVVTKIRASLQAKQGCRATLLNYRKDGTPFWNELTLTPTRDASGNVINFIGVSRDVTGRKANEEAMKALTNKLEQSNQELSDFARVASHDLQEPLRKIQAFGERLRSKDLVQPEGQPYLERMQDAARRMSNLIHDLLSLSRVATKVQPFVLVDLTQLVQGVIGDLEIRIEEVGGKVELGALPSCWADPLQMRQLYQNLIGNALKFHRPGVPPVVKVWGGCTPQGCQFMVADNGIGFDEKYKERIFNVFERLHGRSEYQGTGVGLAICRKIVERHGGTIVAESTPGQGSTFTIMLPTRKTS